MRRETAGLCRLDQVRLATGPEKLRDLFYQACQENQSQVMNLINDSRLHFVTLYILLPHLKELELIPRLNQRSESAIKLTTSLLNYENREGIALATSENYKELKWMWETGIDGDGLEDDYDELMDLVASLLVNQFKDQSILPKMTEIIFSRNRRNALIHNLTWALFSSKNPETLEMIAPYLTSKIDPDRELAKKLLNLTEESRSPEETYQAFLKYYQENKPYLYYTGETMAQKSDPIPFMVDLKKKYASVQTLGKGGILP